MLKGLLAWFALLTAVHAVGLRVATFNIETHRNTEGWPDYALGDPGTPDHDSVAAILGRVDADVVALQEVHTSDLSGSPSEVDQLAATLGLPYLYAGVNSGNFDTSLRVVILSRYPFLSAESITSPPGAKEISRHCPAVVVDIPGTPADPLIISAHLKSGTAAADKFRRAIEMRRLTDYLSSSGFAESDNFIVMGDFNPSSTTTTFTTPPSGLPSTFDLGEDLSLPVTYTPAMITYFGSPQPVLLDPRQLDGDDGTYEFGQTLDLLMVSPGLASRPYATEVYNSEIDVSNSAGLLKFGSPLPAATSSTASDHYMVFADFELDPDLGALGLASSVPSFAEGNGSATLTVTLPEPLGVEVSVSLSSDDSSVVPAAASLTIPAGSVAATTTLSAPRDYLATGVRTVEITAEASGYDADTVTVQILDPDTGYQLTGPGDEVFEDFDGFSGDHDPAPWLSDAVMWAGLDDGSGTAAGARSYGSGDEQAVGYSGQGPMVLETPIVNVSAETMTMLDVSYDAEIWKWLASGAADSIEVELEAGGIVTPLPALGFAPATNAAAGTVLPLATRVTGLAVGPGEDAVLRFHFVPGENSAPPSDAVWINEFHYDNSGTDAGEFVEIVVGPGYAGALTGVQLLLYNGNGGAAYDSATLDSFTLGETTSDGFKIYSKRIPDIQNGSPDGLAVVVGGGVSEFISYEGTFTATTGAASGMTSVDVGVSQNGSGAEEYGSIRRVGTGSSGGDFTWAQDNAVPHSIGTMNAGQSIVAPGLPSQGLAIDRVSVVWQVDTDLDGLADDEDPDDDNDGMSDEDELAFGTDPADAASIFETELVMEGVLQLRFPGAEGVVYTIEWCDDLVSWDHSATIEGNGSAISFGVPNDGDRVFLRVRAGD
ncbi:endonuclease/exonuclease/phosphatase family protein [Haloferula sargassicola]|uniref:Endonuclease/exonuclease/phosphatase domain-containing protein n=1 Tax=Haloferula sargassicola TaxID=490096 RepID=A0ABP9USB1_9BACT